jgi:hypothetical protein
MPPYLDATSDIENTQLALPLVILMTVNEHETNALFDVFLGERQAPLQSTREGVTYTHLGTHDGLRIVSTLCEMGAGASGRLNKDRVRPLITGIREQSFPLALLSGSTRQSKLLVMFLFPHKFRTTNWDGWKIRVP